MKEIHFFGEGAEFEHVGLVVKAIDPLLAPQKIKEPLHAYPSRLLKSTGVPWN